MRCCIFCSYFHLHFEIWTKRRLRIPTIHRALPILFQPELVEILPTKQTHAAANKIIAWCSFIQSLGWSNLVYLYIHFLWASAITHSSRLTINYEGFTPWGIPIARKPHPFKTKQYSWQQIQFCFPLNYKAKQKIGFSPWHLATERNWNRSSYNWPILLQCMWECPGRTYKYTGLSWKTHLHWFVAFPLKQDINMSCVIFICILHDSQNIWWLTTCHRGYKTLLTKLWFFMAVPIWWHHPSLKWHKTNLIYSHEGIFLAFLYNLSLHWHNENSCTSNSVQNVQRFHTFLHSMPEKRPGWRKTVQNWHLADLR